MLESIKFTGIIGIQRKSVVEKDGTYTRKLILTDEDDNTVELNFEGADSDNLQFKQS